MSCELLHWLEEFYARHCDGDWEHSYGFKIDNIDNPGWMIEFDLADTKLSLVEFPDVNEQRSELDWVICQKRDDKFIASGGPRNLRELLTRFREWVEANAPPSGSPWIEYNA
jgi:hypothetical protein